MTAMKIIKKPIIIIKYYNYNFIILYFYYNIILTHAHTRMHAH